MHNLRQNRQLFSVSLGKFCRLINNATEPRVVLGSGAAAYPITPSMFANATEPLGCMAHLRRKFDEALKAQKHPTGRAKEALDMIGKLYHIEAMARKKALPDDLTEIERIHQWRQEKSRPILDALHAWLVKNQKEVMPQSLIGKAIAYAIGQWLYIYRYIDDGR
ncbi:hypothetical protein CR105_27225 [Massilia eurypsychrophila]|uniref:Transposase IS66 central domain-containing protein n=1 Tax=Massilia eurypsychrophila TaxID=1485217 RepID=A0A2G8T7C6_9BURK|nr:hypothetical protein CR105_27225 [Massilia eurypsychrophila]